MQEGFWGNYQTGNYYQIDEHERWIRRGGNAHKLGVSSDISGCFGAFADRETLLPFVFAHAPVMRWRCHGESVTFEFSFEGWARPLYLIQKWCKLFAGEIDCQIIKLRKVSPCFWEQLNSIAIDYDINRNRAKMKRIKDKKLHTCPNNF